MGKIMQIEDSYIMNLMKGGYEGKKLLFYMQGILESLASEPGVDPDKKGLYNRLISRIKTHLNSRRESETLQAVDLGAKEENYVRNETV